MNIWFTMENIIIDLYLVNEAYLDYSEFFQSYFCHSLFQNLIIIHKYFKKLTVHGGWLCGSGCDRSSSGGGDGSSSS